MESKPLVQSATVWVNVLLPVIYILSSQLLSPELAEQVKSTLTPELFGGLLAAVNLVLRIFKTDKPISGVV